MENVRANIEASAAPISWPHLVEHAIDCLNRTTGPPGSALSSFEALTGAKPKIMSIMPFGCTTYAVKPREEPAQPATSEQGDGQSAAA